MAGRLQQVAGAVPEAHRMHAVGLRDAQNFPQRACCASAGLRDRNLDRWRSAMKTIAVASLGAALVASNDAAAQTGGPQGSGPILAAIDWIQGTLLGNVATSIAVIAVAVVGFMMLSGRMNWRHGATVILGCFVLFGAAAIVAGIQAAARVAGG